ncbi:glycosyltransferase family 2 protein [Photobacterium phosphoreum]|uniref:glycosyltransferase family 2 protein n=1 Tax=Photobacterium phosphoreum TaxID=659 RepID=UPI001E598310|nr:glycosyltransferase family 2 protein [Photobacterium phosphoreum]
MSKISVVIPAYNGSKTISSSLYSVIEQDTKLCIEIIIVDDYSKDRDQLIVNVNKIKEKTPDNINIKMLFNDENLGGGASRNIGINASDGDFITFLDSDDMWMKNKISEQISKYQDNSILTTRVLKGATVELSEILPKLIKPMNELISDSLFVHNRLIQTSTFFMSSDIAKDIMFNPSLPRHQDYDFLLRAENKGYQIIQMDIPLSFWRVEDDNSGRFLKKKATPEFFIGWYKEYKKYMTDKASIAYVAKNIFSACMITKKISLFMRFFLSDNFSILDRIKIIKGILLWRWEKLKSE